MVLPLAFAAVACTDYQSSIDELSQHVDGIDQRVTALEGLNEDIEAIKEIVDAQKQAGYITGVTETADGYQFTMSNGKVINVRDGKDGKDGTNGTNGTNGQDGHTPVIGVTQDTDGNWYWTVDGEYLLDAAGNKVRANGIDGQNGTNGTNGQNGENGQNGQNGQDGVTPQIRINPTTGMWEVSYDNGATWTSLGVKAQGDKGDDGDAFFQSVVVGEAEVTFTLADGTTTFTLPLMDTFKKVRDRVQSIVYVPDYFDGQIGVRNDEEQTIRYQVKPAVVATYLADNRDAMMLVGEEVKTTRADGAGIDITGASATRSGALILSVKPTGFEAQLGYAFALDIEADGSSYRTAYTPTFLIVEAEKIALGVIGLYPNMGVVTGGKYFQLYVVFFPDWTTSRGITWTSSDEKMATVSPSGIVAVVDNSPDGEFTITATTTNGKKASLTFKIVDGMLTIDTDQLHQQEEAQ